MKKLLFLLTILFTVGAMAQNNITLPAGNTITGGSGNAGVITLNAFGNGEIILNDKTTINGNSYTSGYATFGQTAIFQSGATMNNTKITGVANGTAANDVVNVLQLNAVKTNINTQVERLDGRIDATNTNLDAETLARKKADEEIYGSISKTNANLDKEVATRKLEVARLDNRIDNMINYVGNEFKAVNNRIDGLGAMTVALSTAATSSIYNPNKPTNVNFATGYYGRSGALALGVSHFLSSNTKLSVNYAAGSFTKSAVGLGVGFAF